MHLRADKFRIHLFICLNTKTLFSIYCVSWQIWVTALDYLTRLISLQKKIQTFYDVSSSRGKENNVCEGKHFSICDFHYAGKQGCRMWLSIWMVSHPPLLPYPLCWQAVGIQVPLTALVLGKEILLGHEVWGLPWAIFMWKKYPC